jgi:hypothetical protein
MTGRRRRQFLKRSAFAGAGFWILGASTGAAADRSPSEKVRVAGIGVGGQGAGDLQGIGGLETVTVVALCDVLVRDGVIGPVKEVHV